MFDKDKLIADAESGLNIMELGEKYGKTFYQVYEILKYSDIDHAKRTKGKRKFRLRDDLPKNRVFGGDNYEKRMENNY